MNKPYEVYQKQTKRNLVFVLATLMTSLGLMLFLASVNLFPWFYHFLQGFQNELQFLNFKRVQFIIGIFMMIIFGLLWRNTIKRIFNNEPILIADDFGLEVNRAADFTVIGWEYIDKISIELYAPSNSERKRPTLIIRYHAQQEKVLFIPISSLSKSGKTVLKSLQQRTKKSKF